MSEAQAHLHQGRVAIYLQKAAFCFNTFIHIIKLIYIKQLSGMENILVPLIVHFLKGMKCNCQEIKATVRFHFKHCRFLL